MKRALPLAASLAAAAVAMAACGSAGPRAVATTSAGEALPTAQASAPIVFIEDDYDRALADAKAKKLPLFVDVWAPWCHTCLSMRAFVFPDEAMKRRAGGFVWLAVDSENDKNEAFLEKHPTEGLPTLWVIDPATEKPVMKWLGSATASEVASLLDDAVSSMRSADGGGQALAALARANELSATGERAEAVKEYRAALAAAKPSWSRRAEAVDALTERLLELGDFAGCVDTALAEAPALAPGTALSDVVQTGMTAAASLPPSDAATAKTAALTALARKLAEDPGLPILPDDRSSLFDRVVDALSRGSPTPSPEAVAVAREWAAFLEAEAAKATTPEARVVFDSHRVTAYLTMGEPERALPMLAESAKDFPRDYNAPARMVAPLVALRRYPEALAASDRALALVYGPRTLRVLSGKADVYEAMGDVADEKKTLKAALDASAKMYGAERARAAIEKRLAGL